MKQIAVVTDHDSELAKVIKDNLEAVFHGLIDIQNYFLDHLEPNTKIHADVVLVMIQERVLPVKAHVSDVKKIIVLKRTLYENEVYKLFRIPQDTEVLVVNDAPETTLETISMLFQLGIDHLQFVPLQDFHPGIRIAVTPGEARLVPSTISEVINLNHRCIDISTFIEIISKLRLEDKAIHKRLIQYSEGILSLDNGIKNAYKDLYIKNEELETIVNLSEEGLLMTDLSGRVQLYNRSFSRMFNVVQSLHSTLIQDFFDPSTRESLADETLSNQVIKFKDKFLNVNKCLMMQFEQPTGVYYNFQEITYIRKLEQNLSRQLKDQGQVARYTFNDLITHSENMRQSIALGRKLASSELSVLITGESGTGKELMAQSIHNDSPRAAQPFVAVNCAAMPETLLESELFGYEPGAFTGALKDGKRGLFEQAHNGTIFLDEIGDMPVLLQTKLLRVLQEQQVMRIGSQRVINIDVRVIAATHKNLIVEIESGRFRQDLYYRLNVLPLQIPPLRARRDDIIPLLQRFMDKPLPLDDVVQSALLAYDWPGNIREVKNVAAYISLMSEQQVSLHNLPHDLQRPSPETESLVATLTQQFDRALMIEFLTLLAKQTERHQGIGRVQLTKLLTSHGHAVSEGEVRSILSRLSDLQVVHTHVGRKGCTLTHQGHQLLNRLLNR